jgi:pyruvate/2-oxoglutarate dehydrogenase complex dihydrolipoamide acyltransferase (E2) component
MSAETQDIPMPRIGEDEDEYTIVAWLKRPGDEIAAGEAIAEAMTEKANVEVESPVAGVLEEILVEEDTVAVGQPIAWVIESEG